MSSSGDQNLVRTPIQDEMKKSYLDYAMSVIVSRAIPDVRDGFKPVHRRILYAMNEIDCMPNKPHKKSARVVGEVMGKYHPHGDSAIYEAMVRMGQDFSIREKLVDGQGNFGSIDADPPASMRYTEARLSKLAATIMTDLFHDTVDFKENYDGTEKEPSVLPVTFPNILVNGTEGIAVGMATSVPTHNLGEVIDCCLSYIDNQEITNEQIFEIMPGPDFPTGAQIIGTKGCMNAIANGRGSVIIRGVTNIEELKGGKQAIVITEIPYQVVKTKLIEKIVELIKEKRIEGISNIRDESNKKGIRLIIELKKDAHSDVIINNLYKHTPLQTSFSYNMLLLNKLRPELMGVKDVIKYFTEFKEEVVVRRINFLLAGARNRAHVVIGLCVAVDSIDEVIKIIRSSKDSSEAREKLASRSWPANSIIEKLINLVHDKKNKIVNGEFYFTEQQIKSILDMKLSRLTGLEKDKLVKELEELGGEISDYLHKLSNKSEIIKIIKEELILIKEKFATPRRTEIIPNEAEDVDIEAFIPKEDMLVTITDDGFIKRNLLDSFNVQRRGGKGKKGMETNDGDCITEVLNVNTHQYILFFSNLGKVYRIKTYKLPLGTTNSKGRAVVNLLPLIPNEKITKIIAVPEKKEDEVSQNIIFATKKGNIRKSNISDFESINANGKIAIKLDIDDALIGVNVAKDEHHVMLCSKSGNAVRFALSDLRVIKSRSSDGVRGMNLGNSDEVVSMCVLDGSEKNTEIRDEYLAIPYSVRKKIINANEIEILSEISQLKKEDGSQKVNLDLIKITEIQSMLKTEQMLLAITENGFGKRSSALEYRITSRGGKGVININTDDRNGSVVSTFVVNDEDEIMLITKSGKVIRCNVSEISVFSRSAKGVKIFDIQKGDKIVSVTKIAQDVTSE